MNQFRVSIDTSLKCENDKLRAELRERGEQASKQTAEFEKLMGKLNSQIDLTVQQEKLIKQLRQVQADMQQTVRAHQATQETLEAENRELKRNYAEIGVKYERSLTSEKRLLAELERVEANAAAQLQQLKSALDAERHDLAKAHKFEIEKLKLQISLQTEQLDGKQAVCDELAHKLNVLQAHLKNVEIPPQRPHPYYTVLNSLEHSINCYLSNFIFGNLKGDGI